MRHPSHSKLRTRAIDSLTHSLTRPLSQRTINYPRPHGHSRGPQVVHKSSGFSLGGADCMRGPGRRWAPSTWRARRNEQERHMHGDGAEGSSQGSRADAGAERRQRPQANFYRVQEVLATWGGSAKQAGSFGLNRP
jgi:hypothetical protein